MLAFGGQLRPTDRVAIYAETDFGGAITTTDFADSGVLVYFAAGLNLLFESAPEPRRGSDP